MFIKVGSPTFTESMSVLKSSVPERKIFHPEKEFLKDFIKLCLHFDTIQIWNEIVQ